MKQLFVVVTSGFNQGQTTISATIIINPHKCLYINKILQSSVTSSKYSALLLAPQTRGILLAQLLAGGAAAGWWCREDPLLLLPHNKPPWLLSAKSTAGSVVQGKLKYFSLRTLFLQRQQLTD